MNVRSSASSSGNPISSSDTSSIEPTSTILATGLVARFSQNEGIRALRNGLVLIDKVRHGPLHFELSYRLGPMAGTRLYKIAHCNLLRSVKMASITGRPSSNRQRVRKKLGRSARIPPELGIVVQDHVQQGIMDFQFSVVFDKTQFAESVHEKAHPRSGRSDHLRQRFLTKLSHDRLRPALLAEICKQKEKPGEALFARIK